MKKKKPAFRGEIGLIKEVKMKQTEKWLFEDVQTNNISLFLLEGAWFILGIAIGWWFL